MVVKLQELLFVAYLREDEDSVACIFELPQHLGHQLQLAARLDESGPFVRTIRQAWGFLKQIEVIIM